MLPTPRTALVVLVAAIALMASAGAGATAALMITGKQVKDGSLTSADVKNRSLKVKDFSPKAKTKLTGATGARGATGPAGPQGPAGTSGLPGRPGLSGFETIRSSIPIPGLGSDTPSVSAVCPAGKTAISAISSYSTPLASLTSVVSQVTRTAPNAFSVTGYNLLPTAQTLNLDVVCANIPS